MRSLFFVLSFLFSFISHASLQTRLQADACIAALKAEGRLVTTRFAPSPTGSLHIGGARTAMFNWLFAKHHGGQFLLRIEDTDQERSKSEHTAGILRSLAQLGLTSDQEPVIQSSRAPRHIEIAKQLVAAGKAYYCYLTKQELDESRERGLKMVESPWRDHPELPAPAGVTPVIRLRVDHAGRTLIEDLIQDKVSYDNQKIDDLILLRSDGTPTYNLAVVVDDHDMNITHVIRGVDHLTNTARQIQIYRAMNWELPQFAHVSLIHGEDGKKLSKRHGAPGLNDFVAQGFLPEAILNYLSRLGWSHQDDEIYSLAQATAWFDVKNVRPSSARLDLNKLRWVNKHYLRQMSDEDLFAQLEARASLEDEVSLEDSVIRERLLRLMPDLKVRASTLVEFYDRAKFIWQAPPHHEIFAAELLERLAHRQFWNADALKNTLSGMDGNNLAIRQALTGAEQGLPLYKVMEVLGQAEVLKRLK